MKNMQNMTLRELVAFVTFMTGKSEDEAMKMTMIDIQETAEQVKHSMKQSQSSNLRSMEGFKNRRN
ncbi:hypothetical protein EPH95_02795 [Salicibibacter halophilus]|uniref:Uncharacterized protein n=1 Tax=Salicibibacter halophilus TaxID=2502791 RepID=A0A514LEG3_9BACI|nr:hypothetical protein [Salicibibacter halophilus]QDI90230.1 hypothetical protein EPH95_02795 [Salicibibacter halophilus]